MVQVLHIIQALTRGGAARSMLATSKYSQRRGDFAHSVAALHSCEPAALELARESGVENILCAPDDESLFAAMTDADIVQIHWWNTPEMQSLLRRSLPEMRLLIWYHVAGDGAPHIITPELMRLADMNIPCNPFSYHDLPIFRDMPSDLKDEHCAMVYDAADFERVEGVELKPHRGFNVGYIGTVDFFKMHPHYVRMSATTTLPDARFIVCGGGRQEILREQARALGDETRFDFRGYVDDIKTVIELFDVYGYPLCENTYAAAELNLQEVMYAGVAPVVFPYGGVKRLIESGQTGLVVHSESEYTEALEYLYHNREERERLGGNAKEYARRVFGAENAASTLNAVYEKVLAMPKQKREWGVERWLPLIEQQVTPEDLGVTTAAPDSSDLFVESLGSAGEVFRQSIDGTNPSDLFNADRQIAASSSLMFDTGIKAYRVFDEEDPRLRFWTGLVLLKNDNTGQAAAEFAAVVRSGSYHWRTLWYLAQALYRSANNSEADKIMTQLRRVVPNLDQYTAAASWAQFSQEVNSTEKTAPSPTPSLAATPDHGTDTILNKGDAQSSPSVPPFSSSPAAVPANSSGMVQAADGLAPSPFLVSVIVSTYASERFLRGCMEELVGQTLFEQGLMEIIVIDAHSPQDEARIVDDFQRRFSNIVYHRTEEREALYASWNRATAMARGRYVANANADDRRRADCFEKLALALEESGAGVAYSDLAFSDVANEPYSTAMRGVWQFPDFDPRLALHYCMGCFSILWRKTAWEQIGGFQAEHYELAADFDFFTRTALLFGAAHVAEPLTMALLHDEQQSKKEEQMTRESESIRAAFTDLPLEDIFPRADLSMVEARSRAYCELGNTAMMLREPWYGEQQSAIKTREAALWYQKALAADESSAPALYNMALLSAIVGHRDAAEQLLQRYAGTSSTPTAEPIRTAEEFFDRVAGGLNHELLLNIPILASEFEAESATESDYEDELLRGETPAGAGASARILFTMYGWDEDGGGTMFPKAVARRLARLGYDVAVFYAAKIHPEVTGPYYLEERREDGVLLYGVFNRPTTFLDAEDPDREVNDPVIVRRFATILNAFQPDVVHFHNFLGLSFALANETQARGIPSFYTPHNYHLIDPALYMIRSDLQRWADTDLLANSELPEKLPAQREAYRRRAAAARLLLTEGLDYVLAVSARVRKLLLDFGGNPARIHVVNQIPPSTELIVAGAQPKRQVHRPLRFGFIGAMIPHKGVHKIVEAAQMLDAGCAEFWIYGYAGPKYREFLDEIDTGAFIRWQGAYQTDDLPAIAENLDAVIVPSVWEECAALVIAEALALNLPVIAARIGGIEDFIVDGRNGRLYDPDSAAELAALLRAMIAEPRELLQLANCPLPYSFNDYTRHVATLYDKVARGATLRPEEITLLFRQDSDEGDQKTVLAGQSTGGAAIRPSDHAAAAQHGQDGPAALNRLQFEQDVQGGFSNRQAQGRLPDPLPSPLYLNVGCGRDVRDGYINLDLYSDDPRVVGMDIRRLDFAANCADGIIASDILEHFSHREVDAVLREWARVLKPGGELIIRCPSLRLQLQAYQRGDWDADVASYMIFGGQTNPGDYHCIAFDDDSIRKHLEAAGLQMFGIEHHDFPQHQGFINLNMTVRARKAPGTPLPGSRTASTGEAVRAVAEQPDPTAVDKVPAAEDHPALNIVWEGSQFVYHSLALINREHCHNILATGVAELTIVPYEQDEFETGDNAKFNALQAHDIRYKTEAAAATKSLPYVWVRHQWPPQAKAPEGAKWVIMQPWEFSALRKDFVSLFNNADEIWTPSNFCREVYVRAGVDADKVQIVPNGIDPHLFTPFGDAFELDSPKRFRFLFVGGTIFRKGIDLLLESYVKTFTADDDVCLVIKDMGGDSFYKGQTAGETIARLREQPDAPAIWYSDARLSEEEMAALYRACDVFVAPYRGEGFSLPTLEAMASGLPVIVTAGGATDDFVDETVGWLLPAERRALGNEISGQAMTDTTYVLEPDSQELGQRMLEAYEQPATGQAKGLAATLRARSIWTWKRATLKMFSRLDYLCGTRLAQDAEAKLREDEDGIMIFARAESELAAGDRDAAIALYQKAIEMKGLPEHFVLQTLHRLALLSLEADEVDMAESFLDKARELRDDHPDTNYIQALCLAYRERWNEAQELLNGLLDPWQQLRFSSRIGLTLDILLADAGRGLYELGFADDARKLFELALQVNSENADACFGAGLCFLQAEAREEARTMFEWAVRLRPEFEAAERALAALTLQDEEEMTGNAENDQGDA